MKNKKWWESSVDSGKLAMRLRGVLVGIVPTILLVAQLQGWDVGEEGLLAIVDVLVNTVAAVGTLVGVIMSIHGYVRKQS